MMLSPLFMQPRKKSRKQKQEREAQFFGQSKLSMRLRKSNLYDFPMAYWCQACIPHTPVAAQHNLSTLETVRRLLWPTRVGRSCRSVHRYGPLTRDPISFTSTWHVHGHNGMRIMNPFSLGWGKGACPHSTLFLPWLAQFHLSSSY